MSKPRLVALRYPNQPMAARLNQIWDSENAALPLSPALSDSEVRALVEALRPDCLEDASGVTELSDGLAVADGVAVVIPTSGASGEPKGVELSHAALRWSAEAYAARLGTEPDERWLCCLPLSHIGGLGILYRSRVAGSAAVIHDRFDVAAVGAERRASLLSLVPTTLLRLLDAGVDLSGYSAVLVGGSGLPAARAQRARDAGVRLVQTYGMTETCGGCNFDGVPLDGIEMMVHQEQILIRGPVLMNGYRLNPDLTAAALKDGWLYTADRGEIDAGGNLKVLGRLDDLIITGGEKVSAVEVENLLLAHPRVADAAVAGIPDPRWGEAVAAAVVPDGPAGTYTELKQFLESRAAPFKIPKHILVVDQIPRTPIGKVRRRELQRLLIDGCSHK